MEAMRQSWTDDRLDDGFARVHSEFARVHSEFARVHSDLRDIRGEVDLVRREMNSFRAETNARFDDLQRTLMQVGGGMIVALLGIVATQL